MKTFKYVLLIYIGIRVYITDNLTECRNVFMCVSVHSFMCLPVCIRSGEGNRELTKIKFKNIIIITPRLPAVSI